MAEAEKLQLAVMEARMKILGRGNLNTLHVMRNLALTYWHQERWAEAEKLQLTVLDRRTGLLGSGNRNTVDATSDLAQTYCSQGRREEAEKLQLAVLERTNMFKFMSRFKDRI